MSLYKQKYLKYKTKYLMLKKQSNSQLGGKDSKDSEASFDTTSHKLFKPTSSSSEHPKQKPKDHDRKPKDHDKKHDKKNYKRTTFDEIDDSIFDSELDSEFDDLSVSSLTDSDSGSEIFEQIK